MTNSFSVRQRLPQLFILSVILLTFGRALSADLNVTGNITATGTIDSDGNSVSFGTQSTSTPTVPGVVFTYTDNSLPNTGGIDSFKSLVNRSAASWLWLNGPNGGPFANVMRLDNTHQLLLFRSDGTTTGLTFTPQTSVIKFGTNANATLTGNDTTGLISAGGPMTVSGAFTAVGGITNTTGAFSGSSALSFNAGGTNQNITLTPSGTGNVILNGNVGIGNPTPTNRLTIGATVHTGYGLSVRSPTYGAVIETTGSTASVAALWVRRFDDLQTLFRVQNDGNVGVGTVTPAATLDVLGTTKFLASTGFYGTRIGSTAGGNSFVWLGSRVGVPVIQGNNETFAGVLPLALQAEGGNLGVGTTTPIATLDVNGSIRSGGNRAIMLDGGTGMIHGQGDTGGWAFGYHATGFSGTDRGGFGFLGSADSLSYYYIGNAYNNPTIVVQPNNGKVGVGTSNPSGKFHVVAGPKQEILTYLPTGVNVADFGVGGVGWGFTRPGDGAMAHAIFTYNSADTLKNNLEISSRSDIVFAAGISGPPSAPERMRITESGNVGIGTTNPGSYKLAVLGSIHATSVVVETGWSDYVFDKDYRLAPLSEVEAHIKEHKHLPGIPSAAEVAEHGVSLGDMQSKLLAKIEELTLRQIAQEKQLNTQASRIAQLEQDNAALRNR